LTDIRAALVTPLTGPLADYGRAGAVALQLWARADPGRVVLSVHDAHPDPVAALHLAEQERPDLLFGPYGSSPTVAVAAAATRLVWNHGGAHVPPSRNLVTVLAPADTYFTGALEVLQRADARLRRVLVLHGDTAFGNAVAAGAVGTAGRLGLQARRRVLPDDEGTDDADVLLVAAGFADELAAARRRLPGGWRAAGFVGAGVDEVLAELGAAREGLLGPAQWVPEPAPEPDEGPPTARFQAAYRRATGHPPPYPAAQAFAAGLVAARCLREAGRGDDASLRAAADRLDCTTLFGRFRLDPATGRQVGHQVLTVQWQDGTRRVVWPADRAQHPLRHPFRSSPPLTAARGCGAGTGGCAPVADARGPRPADPARRRPRGP
jgi:branched-chain amino acid transport system substrate-binding protein